jgi:deazaflavin-dependent oxidoreductase (nitroreductase family)
MLRMVVGVLALALVRFAGAEEEPLLPEVAAALEHIRDRSTMEITTVGRRSGKEHTKPIWFVVLDGKIVVQAGKDGKTDWYRNLEKTPAATVRQGDYVFRARAERVTDAARVERIHRLFRDKYLSARMLSWFGSSIGRGAPVELTPMSVAVRRDGASPR